MKRRARLAGIAATLAAVTAPYAARASALVELSVEPAVPQPGEPFTVRYVVRVQNEARAQIAPLDFGRLELLNAPGPPSLPTMFGGGGFMMTLETESTYLLRAPAPGRYPIGGARVIDASSGRVIAQRPPLVVSVGAGGKLPDDDAADGGPGALAPEPPRDPDLPPPGDLTGAEFNPTAFLRLAVDTPRPYLGQQVTLRAWLYVASSEAACEVLHEPAVTGFWSEPLLPPSRECAARWFGQYIAGRQMSVGLVRRIAVFPAQTGRLTIGPMDANVELATGGLFRSIQQVPASAPTIELEVRDAPTAGRPADFVPGTVGPVTLSAQLDRTNVSVGETATITVRAQSEGSLASARVVIPEHLDGVRVRAGDARTSHDTSSGRAVTTLTQEVLLVPERAGRYALGEVSLPYWDPATERYETARAPLAVLDATGAALPAEPGANADDPSLALQPLITAPALRPYGAWFSRGRSALAWVLTPPIAAALAALARGLGGRAARGRRARAEEQQNDPRALLRAAERTLARDATAALALAGRALERAVSEVDGGTSALPEQVRALVAEARGLCDAARFGGAAGEPREVLARVTAAVRAVEAAP